MKKLIAEPVIKQQGSTGCQSNKGLVATGICFPAKKQKKAGVCTRFCQLYHWGTQATYTIKPGETLRVALRFMELKRWYPVKH